MTITAGAHGPEARRPIKALVSHRYEGGWLPRTRINRNLPDPPRRPDMARCARCSLPEGAGCHYQDDE